MVEHGLILKIDENTGERVIKLLGDFTRTCLGRVKGPATTPTVMTGQDIARKLDLLALQAKSGVCKQVTTMTGFNRCG